jgi:hypothetical protein
MSDSARAKASTLPRKSVAIKPKKTTTMGSRTGGKITVDTAANEKRKAEFNKRTDRALTAASMVPVVRGGMAAKAAYSAAAKRASVPTIKAGIKKGISDKRELSEARSMARGMVKDAAKLKSKTAKAKVTNTVKRNTKNATALQRANSIRKASKAGK